MNVHDEILHRLDKIESDHGVRVLFACESGSRAWNFASGDSDYDVRFLYVHRRDWYLGIDTDARRDVIELPIEDELDINGWDLRKALRLLRKSNPPLLEWIGSPIVYREAGALAERLRVLRETFCSPRACAYHYFHMARGNYRDYLKGPEVRLKKYLYVLRPLLGVKWIEAGFGVVPTPFPELVDRLTDGALREAIDVGWRVSWPYPRDGSWYTLHQDWKLAILHQDPEFIAMMNELEADIAQQRQWFDDHKDDPLF